MVRPGRRIDRAHAVFIIDRRRREPGRPPGLPARPPPLLWGGRRDEPEDSVISFIAPEPAD